MLRELRSGTFGVDILAVTAIGASVVVGEAWAALVIVLMLTGGEALEDYAANRAKRDLTTLLARAPQTEHRLAAYGTDSATHPRAWSQEDRTAESLMIRSGQSYDETMTIEDIGPRPQAFDLETETLQNPNYRTVTWSGTYLQVTLMSIPVNGVIGLEKHPDTDQFIRLDRGRGRAQMGPSKNELTFDQEVTDGWCVIVPAGSWHNVTNIGDEPMQVYTVYAPQHHKPGKVHQTKAIADADADDAPADWSVQPDPVADQHA